MEKDDNIDYTGKYPVGNYTSFYANQDIIGLPQLVELKNFIKTTVQQIHNSIGLAGKLEFTNSWFSINRKYGYHETHNHCPDIWSGVYYLQAEEQDATISFTNRNLINSGWPYGAQKVHHTDFISSKMTCPVKTGLLVIFPSYLDHNVDQQLSDNERISIAFNLNV
jgi:uncharacterized protein (TIGR02466 family)